jgi:hypothetical protein
LRLYSNRQFLFFHFGILSILLILSIPFRECGHSTVRASFKKLRCALTRGKEKIGVLFVLYVLILLFLLVAIIKLARHAEKVPERT